MRVYELIALLESCDEDAEVRLAFQPHYPQQYSLPRHRAVVEVDIMGQNIVYIAEGNQIGGLPRDAREELGWM